MYYPQDLEVYSDGGARGNPGPGASSFLIFNKGIEVFKKSKYLGKTTNNVAEYFAVLLAIFWISKNVGDFKSGRIRFFLDSELVVRQLNGSYKIKNIKLKNISKKIKDIIKENEISIEFIHIPRNKNKKADYLVNKEIDENL